MAEEMSKSAKKRAAQKARDARVAEEAAPAPVPVPVPAAPKSKAAAKSAPAAAAPAAKAAAAPVVAAAAAPKGKAKAKAEAKAQPAPVPAPEPPMTVVTGKKKKGAAAEAAAPPPAQVAPKAAAKGKAKAKAAPAAAPVEPEPVDPFMVMDDGTGGDWDLAVQNPKKEKKKKEEQAIIDDKLPPKNSLYKTDAPTGKSSGKGGGKEKGKAQASSRSAGSRLDMEELTRQVQAEAAAKVAAYARPVAEGQPVEESKVPQFSRNIEMPGDKIGRVIGPKGANIAKIQEHFEGKINRIDTSCGFCTITGDDEQAVESAEKAIRELMTKGFMSISFKDLKEDTVTIKAMYLPEIIGKQGCIIKKIKAETNVEIDIPQDGKGKGKGADAAIDDGGKGTGKGAKGENDGKPVKISLSGEAEDVDRAKAIIEDICKYYCHPLIHDDHVHAEMEVDPDHHRYIIGRGGSEMRHIQKNWNVKVMLPKWDWNGKLLSESENVIVVGEKHDVDRAKAYIEKTLATALDDTKKEPVEVVADRFDQKDDPVEDWMKPYMYKR